MARDADGNYYYDAGTLAEHMDNWEVYEDSDGNVGFYDGTDEFRLQDLGFIQGNFRDSSMGSGDLASGEGAIYWLDNGDTTYSLEAAFHNPDDGAVQTVTLGSVGAV